MNDFDALQHLEQQEAEMRRRLKPEPVRSSRCSRCGRPVDGNLIIRAKPYCNQCTFEESLVDG